MTNRNAAVAQMVRVARGLASSGINRFRFFSVLRVCISAKLLGVDCGKWGSRERRRGEFWLIYSCGALDFVNLSIGLLGTIEKAPGEGTRHVGRNRRSDHPTGRRWWGRQHRWLGADAV